ARARLGRVHREGAGVREQVEHALARGQLGDGAPPFTQIEEEPGAERRGHVDDELDAALLDLELDGRDLAARQRRRLALPFAGLRTEAALLVDGARLPHLLESVVERV